MIRRSYLLGHVMGIPLRVHISLIILLIFAFFKFGSLGIVYTIGIFVCIALHELGHSWIAIRKGYKVHEIMLLPVGGISKMDHSTSRQKDELLIAAAGPLTSLILFGIFFLLMLVDPIKKLCAQLAVINLMLCLFNLILTFPMDGGRIFQALMTPRIGRLKATELASRIGRILAAAFGIFGVFYFHDLFLGLIAFFFYRAARAEYRAVYMQQMSLDGFVAGQADVEVSPPPYARKASHFWTRWSDQTNTFFNDLF
ncbi:MAG: hypothetical protein FJ220_03495, partial [Kiritimatiellaceae bacterium]|nr:hypothetical protein [Kiritimatiellaceae bacterium]